MELCFVLPKVGYNANAMQKYLNLPIDRAAYYRHHHNPTSHKLAHPFPFVPTLPKHGRNSLRKQAPTPLSFASTPNCWEEPILCLVTIRFPYYDEWC